MPGPPSLPSSTAAHQSQIGRVNALLFALLVAFITLALPRAYAAEPLGGPTSKPLPAAVFEKTYRDINGKALSLSPYKQHILLLNFWASWCGPCVREMPALSALHQKYGPQGIKFVGIGVDNTNNIAQFLRKIPVNYPIFVAGGDGADFARQLGNQVGGLPYTVLIDRQGRVRWSKLGSIDATQLSRAIDAIAATDAADGPTDTISR